MCGFFGIFASGPIDTSKSNKIKEVLKSRGPDGSDMYISSKSDLMLIHTRLAILDLNPRAIQPFTTRSGRYTLVYNGEIYNYRELGSDLMRAGLQLRTTSDTEVVAEGFEREGAKFILKLEGMYSIGVYDHHSDELWLFRDSYGIKPLLYYTDHNQIAFSTSAQAILCSNPNIQVDEDSVKELLVNGFIMEPKSLYKNMQWLGESEYLRVKRDGDCVTVKTMRMEDHETDASRPNLCSDIQESIRMHEISDVPVAATLSGGMDSGMIAWYSNATTRFYTATYGTRLNNKDLSSAKRMSSILGKEHISVEVTENDYMYYMANVKRYDLPSVEYSQIPLTTVYRAIKGDGFKVVLSGDGADELLFGYRYMRHLLKSNRKVPLFNMINELAASRKSGLIGKLARRYGFYGQDDLVHQRHYEALRSRSYVKCMSWSKNMEEKTMKGMMELYCGAEEGPTMWRTVCRVESTVGLRNKMLPKVDRASMAESVEVRVPFISRLIARNSINTFQQGKVKAMRACMPESAVEFFSLADKRGFNPPLQNWIKKSGLIAEIKPNSPLMDILAMSRHSLSELIADFNSGDNTATQTVHALLVLNRFVGV